MAVLTSTAGLVATIDATGLANLTLNGTQVLFGGLSAENSSSRFGITGEPSLGAVTTSSVLASNATAAIVRHVHAQAVVQYVYTLDGEDLTIRATITNRTGAPITVLGFNKLSGNWDWETGATGYTGPDVSLTENGLLMFHPSLSNPIGGTVRVVASLGAGVSVYPLGMGVSQTLVHWWLNDTDGYPTIWPAARIFFAPVGGIPDRATVTVAFGIRVSTDTTWQHLLAPYRTQFQASFGTSVAYTPDDRPVVSSFPGGTVTDVSPTNPYGYAGGRFDQAGGVSNYVTNFLPGAAARGAQGTVFWGLAGYDTHGLNYSPDFFVLPAEVEANRAALLTGFQANSLKMGTLTQPGWIRTTSQAAWETDVFFDLAPSQVAGWLVPHFETAITRGFTLFYADTFGQTFEHVQIMQRVRAALGPSTVIYTEFFTDIGLVYAGAYRELFVSTAPFYAGGAIPDANLEKARWMIGGTSVVMSNKSGVQWNTAMLDWAYQHKHSPLLADWSLPTASELTTRNATYLVANHWA